MAVKTKTIPPPRELWFECPHCGTYRVSEETLRKFLTPPLRQKLDDRLSHGAIGAKLKFKDDCPRCKPEGTHEVELRALRARTHH